MFDFPSLIKLVFVLIISIVFNGSIAVEANRERPPPNIIMIIADDMGFDDVSFRGSKEFLTPNIDALAYHGKILDRLYAPAMCTPSRGALLTGRYPSHTGTQHYVISNEEPWSLPTNVTTIAQIFQQAGYSTNLVGKWHLGYAKKEYTPTYRGFDYHYGYWGGYIDYYQRRAKMPIPNYSLGYDFRRNMDVECAELGTYVTDLLSNEAERIITSNNGTKPLFLLVNHLAPHTGNVDDPLQAPVEEIMKFKYIKDPARRKYAAMVSKLDQSVGRIIRSLERSSMLANSIVIFYSDNGAPSVGMFANTGSNWPFRGQKRTPWEGGVRVAGAIWSPLLTERNTVFRQPLYVGDWLPTLAAAADIQLEPKMYFDGINLWPELVGSSSDKVKEREILHMLDDVWHVASYMRGPWKYINGSTLNGVYDNVLTYREQDDVDPRNQRYVVEVRNSWASQALRKYDEQRLTMNRIERLRAEAGVRCGTMQRSCNTLIEECLFNLDEDPCEQNNLLREERAAQILHEMREQVVKFRKSAWPAGNRAGKLEYDPSRHDCTWSNFLQEPPMEVAHNCDYNGHSPCELDSKMEK